MTKKYFLFALVFITMLFVSGCDGIENVPIENILQTTSIVGQIGNVNKKDTQFLVKAYPADDTSTAVSWCLADNKGYFQIVLSEEGSYVLKVEYAFKQETREYKELYRYNEQRVKPVKVVKDRVSNIGVIYTSIYDVYAEQIKEELESEGTLRVEVDVNPSGSGIQTIYDPLNDSFKNRQIYLRIMIEATMEDDVFKRMYEILKNNVEVEIIFNIFYI